jgi:hypothetical protein
MLEVFQHMTTVLTLPYQPQHKSDKDDPRPSARDEGQNQSNFFNKGLKERIEAKKVQIKIEM